MSRCRFFSTQIGPRQLSLRSNAIFAVVSLAVATLATASFLAADRAGSSLFASGFLALMPSAPLCFDVAAPVSDFFWIAMFVTHFRRELSLSGVLRFQPSWVFDANSVAASDNLARRLFQATRY